MNTTTKPHTMMSSVSTIVAGGACAVGLAVVVALGPQNAWAAVTGSSSDSQPSPLRQQSPVRQQAPTYEHVHTITVERPCFMTPLNWPTAIAGPLPTCTREQVVSTPKVDTVQKQRPPAPTGVLEYSGPCYMGRPGMGSDRLGDLGGGGEIPNCLRLVHR